MEMQDMVDFLKDPGKFTRLGGRLPKGLLMLGPPGTGKTLLAKAVAGEAGVPFFYCSGSEFEEMYVGVGARRVRDLFAAAKKNSPCIIFIDEIDAIGGKRSAKHIQATHMTLNQLLVELDGFTSDSGVVVVGATNFAQLLDKALIRPGRFDTQITVPLPDQRGRKEILDLYVKRIKVDDDVDTTVLARGTPGCSGAELETLINAAAVRASIKNKASVTMHDVEWAKDKILMGAERTSAVISADAKRLTAYHEGGHALMAINTPGAHPIHKATVMPRGQALGMVHQLPKDDQVLASKKQLIAQMDVCMGGRVAEEIIFGADSITSGASSDIQKATQIAREMVLRYGMTSEVGLVSMHEDDINSLSPATRQIIDNKIKSMLDDSYERARNVLTDKHEDLERLAQGLIEYETLDSSEIKRVIKGEKLKRSM